MIQIVCYTLFDITPSGIKSHIKALQFPTTDRTGAALNNADDWTRARNQQRNWETILQVVSLRTQPENCSDPVSFVTDFKQTQFRVKGKGKVWSFAFESEIDDAFEISENAIGALELDVHQVPMVIGLNETSVKVPHIISGGPNTNTYFTYEKL